MIEPPSPSIWSSEVNKDRTGREDLPRRLGWTPELEAACADSCAEFGDPPCLRVEPGCDPCEDCLRACGFEPPPPPPDPAAVVEPLL